MAISRRKFIKQSAVVGAAATIPLATASNVMGANDRIRVGVIGVNGRGTSHMHYFGKKFGDNLVAICDCDENVVNTRAKDLDVDTETDFRRLLDRKDIDAVSIATPNHWHSLMAIMAAEAGKDVYVEKPVSHNVWEGRQLVNAARKYKRIIQCGTQIRSNPGVRDAVKYVQDGNLGKIKYVVGTCYKRRGSIGQLDKPLQIPAHVDYDLWCGPAEKVDLYRPKMHYDWHWDFNTGNGDTGNQGIHQMDVARWFLGESELSPRVMSIGGRLGYEDAANTANTQTVIHDYDSAPLIFETRGLPTEKYRGSGVGVVVQCEKGYVLVPAYHASFAYDNDGNEIKRWVESGDHYTNFLNAMRSRNHNDLNAEILDGHLSSALCHTGNISHRLGTKRPAGEIVQAIKSNERLSDSFGRMLAHLEENKVDVSGKTLTYGPWLEMDPSTERFTNSEAANALVTREYRAPFVVPDLSPEVETEEPRRRFRRRRNRA